MHHIQKRRRLHQTCTFAAFLAHECIVTLQTLEHEFFHFLPSELELSVVPLILRFIGRRMRFASENIRLDVLLRALRLLC